MHDDCAGTPTKSNASGGSGYRDGIDGAGSHGTASPKSSSDIHSLPPGSSINTPLRAKLSREEPEKRYIGASSSGSTGMGLSTSAGHVNTSPRTCHRIYPKISRAMAPGTTASPTRP